MTFFVLKAMVTTGGSPAPAPVSGSPATAGIAGQQSYPERVLFCVCVQKRINEQTNTVNP